MGIRAMGMGEHIVQEGHERERTRKRLRRVITGRRSRKELNAKDEGERKRVTANQDEEALTKISISIFPNTPLKLKL